MMYRISVVLLVCLGSCVASVFGEEISSSEIRILDIGLKRFVEAFNSHDAQELANGFAEDGELVGEDGTRFKGRANIQAMYADLFEMEPQVRSEVSDVRRKMVDGGAIIEEGTYRVHGLKDALPQQGHYCALLVKQGDQWVVRHEQDYISVLAAGAVKAQIKKANEEYEAIILKGGKEGYEKILSDDYVFIDTEGAIKNKADVLAEEEKGTTQFEVARSEEIVTRCYGNTAILTGLWYEKGVENNEPFDRKTRFTTVFAKRDGRWLVVSDQLTNVESK